MERSENQGSFSEELKENAFFHGKLTIETATFFIKIVFSHDEIFPLPLKKKDDDLLLF